MWGDGRIFRRGQRYWIAYSVQGVERREAGGRNEPEARKRLRARLKEIRSGTYRGPEEERLRVSDLLDSLFTHLELKGAKSLVPLRSHAKPIEERFGSVRALELSAGDVDAYARERLAAGKAPATVNRELQPLKQAFNLARKQGRLSRSLYVPMLREQNVRQGFFEREEFEALLRWLPAPIDDVARFAYVSGWRRGEIIGLRWDAVDRRGRMIHLPTSKSGHGRVLPLDGTLARIIERRWSSQRVPLRDGTLGLAEYVFHRQGRRIIEFKRSWASACRKAGIPGKLFHDLRRTAVRNMVRAGVPQSVAMAISGHRTISMFLRYNITSEEDLRKALRAIEAPSAARR